MPSNPNDTLLTFPCDFTIKVFGLANADFEATALSIVRQQVPSFSDTVLTSRLSENGKYLALSITVHVDSKAQLDSIYQALSKAPNIIMVL